MTTLMMIFGGVLIGVGLGLMSPTSDKKKPWKPKKYTPRGKNKTTYPGYTSYS